MIHKSPYPDIEIPDQSMFEYVFEHASTYGDEIAFVDGPSGRSYSFIQMEAGVRALAGGLVGRGFEKGDVVALLAPNLPEYAIVFHGVAMAGGVVTTINPTYTPAEVHHQLTDAGASMVITIDMFLDTARAGSEGTAVSEIFVIGESESAPSFQQLFGEPLPAQVPVEPDDLVVLPYSSGTTGLSKGVMLTHHNLVANVAQTMAVSDTSRGEVAIAVLPFFHIYGMQVLMNMGLRLGVKLVTMPRFDLEQFLTLHQDHKITRSFIVPPIVVALAKHPMVDQFDLSALKQIFSGAAPLSAETGDEVQARLGCEVVQGYGMTEMSPVSHLTPTGQAKPGSVGITAPNTETMIVDPATGDSLGYDEDGEVWVRGPQIMKGYLNNEAATAATIDEDGWIHTGDIGHVDEDGHLYVVDRLKELIKYKAFQVAPAELEAVLLTHPAVADAAVIGLPDDEAGEIPAGYVVLKAGQEATAEEIQAHVANQVAHYKAVRQLTFLDEIPKSASGKILRRVLRDQAGV